MFHSTPAAIAARMTFLELHDAADRDDGTARMQRLRQIPPETGRFLALWAACAPKGSWLEIGTSAGYSTLWLALAAQISGASITTFEVLPEKVAMARETFQLAGVADLVELVADDARNHISRFSGIAFCFVDAEKEVYGQVYDMVVPRLVHGGILIADNAINHREALQPMLDRALSDNRVDALIVPIGKGELVCRRL